MKRMLVALALAMATVAPTFAQTTTTAPAETQTATKPVKTRVALIKLSGEMLERPASFDFSLFGGFSNPKAPNVATMLTTLNRAAKDPQLGGVVLDLSAFNLSITHANEIGAALKSVRAGGKRVAIYAADFDTATYLLATHADTIVMPENGNVLLPGVAMQLMFSKGTLEKLNMSADFVQVGKFKGAEEPFTRTSSSPEFKEQIDGLVDGAYDHIVKTISTNRPNLTAADVRNIIDEGWFSGKRAKALGLVDHTLGREKLDAWVNSQFENGTLQVTDYGQPKKPAGEADSPFAILQMFSGAAKPAKRNTVPTVAVLYATGQIMPDVGESGGGDGLVTPGTIRAAVDKALKDDMVKAIVLRIDSPGGSASASDEIWQILKEADKKKPVTVSMGRVAASGGYYIACAGRSITADPGTITGSIGVVGGKIVMKGLMDKVGLNIETHARGKNAEIFNMMRPFSDDERALIAKNMTETYATFQNRVMSARGKKIAKFEDVAQGRLFFGSAAVKAGLVDQVGSLNDVIVAAAKDAGIEKNYQTMVLPEPRTFADMLREGFAMDVTSPTLEAAMQGLPREYRAEVVRALRMANTLQREKLLMALPVGISGN